MIQLEKSRTRVRQIAIIGNPNSGKSTLFNALTGLRQKVGNYPGVTVEKKEGRIPIDDTSEAVIIDLPGAYSLTPNSPDEQIAIDILLGKSPQSSPIDIVICTIDASNLERNLYLATQIIDWQIPVILALTMLDVAEQLGIRIDTSVLSHELGVQVVPVNALQGTGINELKKALAGDYHPFPRKRVWRLPEIVEEELDELTALLERHESLSSAEALHQAIHLLSSNNGLLNDETLSREIVNHVQKDRERLDFLEIDRQAVFVESRYAWIKHVCSKSVTNTMAPPLSFSDRVDRIVLHRVWGYVIFLGLMAVLFQSVFAWATLPMEWISSGFDWIGRKVVEVMPPGDLRNLTVNGALSGVSAVVVFLPQILFLFLFLGLLEDSGYMARAAFLMDRLMSKVGLHGKSFIPLLSSFACAIPGIMATRTIDSPKDRLATMLVAPLMSCSARLPVYTLLISAFVPGVMVAGIFSLSGLTLLSLYLFGLITALVMAWLFKKTFLRGAPPAFLLELPPYRRPSMKSILLQMWERSRLFLKQAGTFILGVSIVLWFLASYPRLKDGSPSEQLKQSFAGQAGQFIEPLIQPLGFDWKIGIGLIGSILQREVFVSTMGTIYNIQNTNLEEGSISLREQLQRERDPVTGKPTFTLLTALCLMVYYMLAMQCLSTVAVMRRETNGWKWPLFQIGYMTLLAYGATFIVYRGGLMLSLGD